VTFQASMPVNFFIK